MKLSTKNQLLTKRQLEDAAKCIEISCLDCNAYDVCPEHTIEFIDKFAQTALEYRKELEELICAVKNELEGGKQAKHSIFLETKITKAEALLKESEGEEE